LKLELSKWVETRKSTRLTRVQAELGWNIFTNFNTDWFLTRHLEPDSSGLNPWWVRLAHQHADKRVTQVFFFLLSWALLGHVKLFFYPTRK